jgi:hypothetical protein
MSRTRSRTFKTAHVTQIISQCNGMLKYDVTDFTQRMLRWGRNLSPTFQVQTVMNQLASFFALEHLTALFRSSIFVVIDEERRCQEGETAERKKKFLNTGRTYCPLNPRSLLVISVRNIYISLTLWSVLWDIFSLCWKGCWNSGVKQENKLLDIS